MIDVPKLEKKPDLKEMGRKLLKLQKLKKSAEKIDVLAEMHLDSAILMADHCNEEEKFEGTVMWWIGGLVAGFVALSGIVWWIIQKQAGG